MKNLINFIVLLSSFICHLPSAYAQSPTSTYRINGKQTRLSNPDGTPNELIIENATKTKTGGYLKNKGNGLTEFAYAVDSLKLAGDTLQYWKDGMKFIVLPSTPLYPGHFYTDSLGQLRLQDSLFKRADSIITNNIINGPVISLDSLLTYAGGDGFVQTPRGTWTSNGDARLIYAESIVNGANEKIQADYQGPANRNAGISLSLTTALGHYDEANNFSLVVNTAGNYLSVKGTYEQYHEGPAALAGDHYFVAIQDSVFSTGYIRAGVATTLYTFTGKYAGFVYRKSSSRVPNAVVLNPSRGNLPTDASNLSTYLQKRTLPEAKVWIGDINSDAVPQTISGDGVLYANGHLVVNRDTFYTQAQVDAAISANAYAGWTVDSANASGYWLRRKDSSVVGGYYPFATNPKGYLTSANNTIRKVGTSFMFDNSGNGGTGSSEGSGNNLFNLWFGSYIGITNTTGYANVALQDAALRFNTTGNNNIAIGSAALISNSIGNSNIALGTQALSDNTSGLNNIGIGHDVLTANSTGNNNIAIGYLSASNLSTGNKNIILGYRNRGISSGSSNILLGDSAVSLSNTLQNAVAFGARAMVGLSNAFSFGDTASATKSKVGIGTAYPQASLHIKGNLAVQDGTQGSGKVFTSDANGFGSWQIASGVGSDTLKADKTGSSDIEITDFAKGIILRTSDGTRARITLKKDGSGNLYLEISDPL